MIADLKPYRHCAESGIPWAPSLPYGWKTERAKRLFTKMDRPVREEDEVVTCFRDGMVTLRKNRRLRGFTEATAFSGYQGIRKGDLVIHGMDAFAGAIGVSDSDGKGTPVYNVCQPNAGVDAMYYAHAVRQMSQSQWILALAKGIRERSTDFRFATFGNQRVPIPSPLEQAAIVRFLGWANGRLERAIRAKRKVIALLNEQKQATIHRAVTRGLDPSVPLRASGIPWLGDIPHHWELKRAKVLFAKKARPVSVGAETITCFRDGTVTLRRNRRTTGFTESFKEIGYQGICRGDLVISAMDAFAGAIGVSDSDGKATPVYSVCEAKVSLNSHYFARLIRVMAQSQWILCLATGIRQRSTDFRFADFGNQRFCAPPLNEQSRIVEVLEHEESEIHAVVLRLTREIELLREYRTRLVADVVTGKLDVREAAARVPDDAARDTVEDDTDPSLDPEAADEDSVV